MALADLLPQLRARLAVALQRGAGLAGVGLQVGQVDQVLDRADFVAVVAAQRQ